MNLNMAELWYGGGISGVYSEKASYGGQPGIGHPNYATTATGTLYLAATGLRAKNLGQLTTVMLLDAQATSKANRGVWPGNPAELRGVLAANPALILLQVRDLTEFHRRVNGIPSGTKVVVVAGAEGVLEGSTPPQSQAMVLKMMQVPSAWKQKALSAPGVQVGALSTKIRSAFIPGTGLGLTNRR